VIFLGCQNLDLNVPQLSSLSPNLFEDIDLDINQLPFEIEPGVLIILISIDNFYLTCNLYYHNFIRF